MVKLHRMMGYGLCLMFLVSLVACSGSPVSRSTGTYASDEWITAKVKGALAKNPDTAAHDINVETFRGTVQLSGFVDKEDSIDKATEVAKGIDGVKKVINNLTVKPRREPEKQGSSY